MIFYPISYRGLNLYRRPEVPLGLIGWQGIVPCKTRTMSLSMVDMVTTQLLSIQEVFQRLDPRRVAELLAPEVPKLGQSIIDELIIPTPATAAAVSTAATAAAQNIGSMGTHNNIGTGIQLWLSNSISKVPSSIYTGLPTQTKELISHLNIQFLKEFTISMQTNIDSLFNIQNCVIDQMVKDRSKLGMLFQKCGKVELEFLTNSGLWFGFGLGLIQMVVALFWDNPWSLSIGGGIVGLATNWLALKWIFEPVNPTKIGPFILQGQFLRRQKEVAKEFSDFFANQILTSEKMFHSILTDPSTAPAFRELFTDHLTKFAKLVTAGLGILPEPEVMKMAVARAVDKLPNHIGVLHSYVDDKLNLQETLRISMEQMSSVQFERVLHPIFEEDELTLILAGAALGFAAGLVQQGLETGKIQLSSPKAMWRGLLNMIQSIRSFNPSQAVKKCVNLSCSKIRNVIQRVKNFKKGTSREGDDDSTRSNE